MSGSGAPGNATNSPALAVASAICPEFWTQSELPVSNATLAGVSTDEGTFARYAALRAAESLERTRSGPQRPLEALAALRHARLLTLRAEIFWIDAARAEGCSWSAIAAARGTTRQNEAQSAHRREVEAAREPFDRWLDAWMESFTEQRRVERRREVIGW